MQQYAPQALANVQNVLKSALPELDQLIKTWCNWRPTYSSNRKVGGQFKFHTEKSEAIDIGVLPGERKWIF